VFLVDLGQSFHLLPAQARQVRRVRVIDDLAFFSGAGNDATDLLVLKNPAQGKVRHAYAGRDRLPDLLDRFQGNVKIHSGKRLAAVKLLTLASVLAVVVRGELRVFADFAAQEAAGERKTN
jgi:hypothetical protein